jgi:hypothetical protein
MKDVQVVIVLFSVQTFTRKQMRSASGSETEKD